MRLHELKRLFVGTPLPTAQSRHERLGKASGARGLRLRPALLGGLRDRGDPPRAHPGRAARRSSYSLPIGVGIAALILIVIASYRQTIRAYPQGGGAYIVAKDNLGIVPALVAGAALLIDYVLTVAVSVAAGVDAVTSAFPPLFPYRVVALPARHRRHRHREPARACGSPGRSSRCRPTSSS